MARSRSPYVTETGVPAMREARKPASSAVWGGERKSMSLVPSATRANFA